MPPTLYELRDLWEDDLEMPLGRSGRACCDRFVSILQIITLNSLESIRARGTSFDYSLGVLTGAHADRQLLFVILFSMRSLGLVAIDHEKGCWTPTTKGLDLLEGILEHGFDWLDDDGLSPVTSPA